MRGVPRALVWVFVAGFLVSTRATAQATNRPLRYVGGLTRVTFPLTPIASLGRVPLALQRPVTLDLVAVPLDRALREVMRAGGLAINYSPSIVPVTHRVSVHVTDAPVIEALRQALARVPVELWVTGDGRMALVPATVIPPDSVTPVRGVVSDSLSGRPVGEVNVLLKGTKIGALTRADGVFRLRVPNAPGTLVFYRIGYAAKEVPFVAGATTVDVKLAAAAATLSAVQITAENRRLRPVEHTSDLAVVEEIKASPSVVSGISSEQIAKSADLNAAQIVRHISGVTVTDESFLVVRGMSQRYNATYLGDNLAPSTELYSRAFDLSLIPDRIVDKILVYKSPRADLIGDMTGAAVKIYTKDALAIRHFDLSVRGGDRPSMTGRDMLAYSGGGTDWLGIDDGTRSLPSDVPGYGNFQHATLSQSRYIASFSPVLGDKLAVAPADGQVTANYYDNWKLGGPSLYNVASASYTAESRDYGVYQQQGNSQVGMYNSPHGQFIQTIEHDQVGSQKVNLNLMENLTLRVNDAHQLYFKNFLLQQGTALTADQIKYPNDTIFSPPPDVRRGIFGTWNRNVVLNWEQRTLYQGNLGGTHELSPMQSFAWNVGLTSSLHLVPDQRTTRFTNSNAYLQDDPSANNPQSFPLSWTALDRTGTLSYLAIGTISRIWTRNAEQLYNGSIDYTVSPVQWLDLKLGTYDYVKARTVARREYLVYDGELAVNPPGLVTSAGTYGPPGSARYVNPSLIYFSPQNLAQVWSTTRFRDDMTGLAVVDATGPTDAYQATEGYSAGYVMTNLRPFGGHIELNGGVRVEYDQLRLAAAEDPRGFMQGSGALVAPVLVQHNVTSVLPSVNLAWRPSAMFVARASYGKTVNRPEFREISPFEDYNYQDNTVVIGNPSLVTATIDNYDVRLELYPTSRGDAWSVGAFTKNLRHPIERIDEDLTYNGTGLAFLEDISYANTPRATVEGLEADVRQGLIWNFSAIASGALIHSHVSAGVPYTGATGFGFYNRPLQGQAPYVMDLGLVYDNARIGTKISTTYSISGTSIYAVGATHNDTSAVAVTAVRRGSILQLPQGLLEAAVTQSIGSAWRFKLSGQNLLNEATRFAQDELLTSKYVPEHLTTVTESNGSKVTQYVGDNIFRRFNLGRYVLLTITRSF